MKQIFYVVSFSAFQDDFQMGKLTVRLCVSNLAKGIVECPDIADIYLCTPSQHNARHIVVLHKEQHGIDGMLGSLDITHDCWTDCLNAWKGHF